MQSIPVSSLKSLDRGMRRAGEIHAALAEATATKSAAETAVLETHQPLCTELLAALTEQHRQINAYVASKRDVLFGDETSIEIPGGQLVIRQRPESVLIEKGQEAAIVARLLKDKKLQFLSTPAPKLDKKALLKARPRLKGITYGRSGESLDLIPVTSGEKVTLDLLIPDAA